MWAAYFVLVPGLAQSVLSIDRRTCKHLRQYRGEEVEQRRVENLFRPLRKPLLNPSRRRYFSPKRGITSKTSPVGGSVKSWMACAPSGRASGFYPAGNPYFTPAWFTAGLPAIRLDGELWLGRRKFQRTVSIVRRQDGGEAGEMFCSPIFDAPACRPVV